jgi:hypothetical protein
VLAIVGQGGIELRRGGGFCMLCTREVDKHDQKEIKDRYIGVKGMDEQLKTNCG